MSELLKKQNYGVEVEFTGITRAMAAKAVAEVIGGTVTGPDHTCYRTRIIRDSQGRKWKIMRDSSIIPVRKTGNANMDEYRVEFVTPILKYDDLETLQAIIRKFREIGGVPHASCGIPCHSKRKTYLSNYIKRHIAVIPYSKPQYNIQNVSGKELNCSYPDSTDKHLFPYEHIPS